MRTLRIAKEAHVDSALAWRLLIPDQMELRQTGEPSAYQIISDHDELSCPDAQHF